MGNMAIRRWADLKSEVHLSEIDRVDYLPLSSGHESTKKPCILTIVAAAFVWVSAAAGCYSGSTPIITSNQAAGVSW
jgi:hypothetical protein